MGSTKAKKKPLMEMAGCLYRVRLLGREEGSVLACGQAHKRGKAHLTCHGEIDHRALSVPIQGEVFPDQELRFMEQDCV